MSKMVSLLIADVRLAASIPKWSTELTLRLAYSGVNFGSELNERYFFDWALQIQALCAEARFTRRESMELSQISLSDILTLFSQYQTSMKQLTLFKNASPLMYWCTRFIGQAEIGKLTTREDKMDNDKFYQNLAEKLLVELERTSQRRLNQTDRCFPCGHAGVIAVSD